MTIDQTLFNQDQFTAWLEAQAPGATVGIACRSDECPLAWWLRFLNIKVSVLSDRAFIFGDNAGKLIWLPEWAKWFTKTMDILGSGHHCVRENAIEVVKGIKCKSDKNKKQLSK